MFDIYGNKNGDWSQSAFSFEWSLRDGDGVDQTALLSSTTSENVHYTVPAGAETGDTYIATLTVTGDFALAGDPAEVAVVVSETVGKATCSTCHSSTYSTYENTTHATAYGGSLTVNYATAPVVCMPPPWIRQIFPKPTGRVTADNAMISLRSGRNHATLIHLLSAMRKFLLR